MLLRSNVGSGGAAGLAGAALVPLGIPGVWTGPAAPLDGPYTGGGGGGILGAGGGGPDRSGACAYMCCQP